MAGSAHTAHIWASAQVVSFPGELLTLHITPLDDIGDATYGLVYLAVEEGGHMVDVSCHFVDHAIQPISRST